MSEDPWKNILDADEEILWQGRSKAGLSASDISWGEVIFGVAFVYIGFGGGFERFYNGDGGGLWLVPIIFGCIGVWNVFHATIWKWFVSGRRFYTLTEKRGFIGTVLPFGQRKLKSHPLNIDPEYTEFGNGLSRISFSKEEWRDNEGEKKTKIHSFDRVPNGLEVFRLMKRD